MTPPVERPLISERVFNLCLVLIAIGAALALWMDIA